MWVLVDPRELDEGRMKKQTHNIDYLYTVKYLTHSNLLSIPPPLFIPCRCTCTFGRATLDYRCRPSYLAQHLASKPSVVQPPGIHIRIFLPPPPPLLLITTTFITTTTIITATTTFITTTFITTTPPSTTTTLLPVTLFDA